MGLVRADKFDGRENLVLTQNTASRPLGVIAYHPVRQPDGKCSLKLKGKRMYLWILCILLVLNACANNGRCQHLCVLSHNTVNGGAGYKCMCDFGYELNRDGYSCKSKCKS